MFLDCFQNDKAFYLFTAYGGGNEHNTKYDANCMADRAYQHWTCNPNDDTLKPCYEYFNCTDKQCFEGCTFDNANGGILCGQLEICSGREDQGENENAECKCPHKSELDKENDKYGWYCPKAWKCERWKDGNCEKGTLENKCPEEHKICGRSYIGATTTGYGVCPKPCRCLEWTCPEGEDNCAVQDKICKGGCKYCKDPHAVCPPHMVNDDDSDLKPAWNLIR